jgi:outer membrane protein
MKRALLASLALLILAGVLSAQQQITRVSVIDLQKVYMTYYKDSHAVRAFEDEKARIQAEITRLGQEIKEIQRLQLEYRQAGQASEAAALNTTLYHKTQFLADFIKVKQSELDAKAKNLSESDAFVQMLYRTIQSVAELDGFSLVLSSRNTDGVGSSIIWFSPMIDITDKVIQILLGAGSG